MNSQNISEKPTKSTIWIVGTIWANIIIVGLILVVVLLVLNFLISHLFGLPGLIFVEGWLWRVIMWLASISAFIYGIRLGVISVIKKSAVLKKDIVKISVWVAMVAIVGQLGLIILNFSLTGTFIGISRLLEFIGANIGYFVITYFWFKKLV